MSATQNTTETETAQPAIEHVDVRTLAENMNVPEVRSWMSENGLTRSRGARKMESLRQARKQEPELVTEKAESFRGTCEVTCPQCDLEESAATAEAAEEAAGEHKSENPTHFPVARDEDGEAVYGV